MSRTIETSKKLQGEKFLFEWIAKLLYRSG